jgi:hypothetical protein
LKALHGLGVALSKLAESGGVEVQAIAFMAEAL